MTDPHPHSHEGLPPLQLHSPEQEGGRRRILRKTAWLALAVLLLLGLGLARSLYVRWAQAKVLDQRAAAQAVLHVHVIDPKPAQGEARLSLPGTLLGVQEAQIYARTTGYVRKLNKDIGDPVRKGEVLAELDVPDVDRQVEEARASHQRAETAYRRWTELRAVDAVSQDELDEKTGAFKQTKAALQRLLEQQGFSRVAAPFDGIVTRRNVNVGDLVNAGNGGPAQVLFALSSIDRLHVYAYLPQDSAAQVKIGDRVTIRRASAPDQPVEGRIARTAGAIDTSTRTLQVDIEVPNPKRALLPGSYVDVVLNLARPNTLLLPTNTLLFRGADTQVAVAVEGKALRRKVTVGTDYGRNVEIRSGIAAGDKVILNPPDSIADGQILAIEPDKPPREGAGK
ncbi:MAG: efflux RND transporter periplasmic adaptor subunit [Rhodocyclaceae bacterium]|nr:efflux RND transporter periplasmic adaptor subunit [Rhodocyclaceae bacterium]